MKFDINKAKEECPVTENDHIIICLASSSIDESEEGEIKIILPDEVKKETRDREGRILYVGDKVRDDWPKITEGKKALFGLYDGIDITFPDGRTYVILQPQMIWAFFKEEVAE
jgi:co-chaperonin GroES (HSP10)